MMALFTSCYYDVEEDLYETPECTVANMSYQNDILPIIQNNCYGCHDAKNNFGNVTLEGYNGLSTYVMNGKLLGVIKHAPGFPSMPQNANMLLECEIEKIESWVTDGAPNN